MFFVQPTEIITEITTQARIQIVFCCFFMRITEIWIGEFWMGCILVLFAGKRLWWFFFPLTKQFKMSERNDEAERNRESSWYIVLQKTMISGLQMIIHRMVLSSALTSFMAFQMPWFMNVRSFNEQKFQIWCWIKKRTICRLISARFHSLNQHKHWAFQLHARYFQVEFVSVFFFKVETLKNNKHRFFFVLDYQNTVQVRKKNSPCTYVHFV